MGASSAAIVTGQVFDVSMPAGEVEEAKEVASRKVSSAGRPLVIVQLAQIIGRWMDDGPAPFFASMAL